MEPYPFVKTAAHRVQATRLAIVLTAVLSVLAAFLVAAAPAAQAAIVAPFTSKYSVNAAGAIRLVGNTLLTCSTAAGATNASSCVAGRNGTGKVNNNDFTMVNVDVDGDPGTFNSSTADFALPSGAGVLYARLFWGARSTNATRNSMQFKVPGQGYQSVTANPADVFLATDKRSYSASADVTGTVRSAGAGTYTGANVQADTGASDLDAGWSLIIVYADHNEPVRAMSVFTGYANVASKESVNIDISGFKTPTGGPVKTEIGVVSYEGDLGLVGDSFSISRKVGGGWGPAQQISDPARAATNFFNSTITQPIGQHISTKSPNYQNQLGFDVGRIDASGKLANGDTDARLTASSNGDVYYPSAITFATELFAPNMPTVKSAVDLNGGDLKPGDTVHYTIVAQNKGQDALDSAVLTDTFPAGTTYVPGSLKINGTGGHDADISGQQLTSNLGNQAIDAQVMLTYDLTVNSDTPSGTVLRNIATLNGNGHDTGIEFTFPSNEVVLTVTNPNAVLTLNKVGVDQVPGTPGVQFAAGADAEYHLTVTNNGPDIADPPLVVS
ncbi:MAG: isopeptide-forming domain-containing fimbrial protein, partial [Actinomycetes bacterium]